MIAAGGELRQYGAMELLGSTILPDKEKMAAVKPLIQPEHIHGIVAADRSFAGVEWASLPVGCQGGLLFFEVLGKKGRQRRDLQSFKTEGIGRAVLLIQPPKRGYRAAGGGVPA